MIYMPLGQEDFKQLRESSNLIYIDKTYFIKEWWESNDKITLITRPRCFGKSLNMSMIDYFFSNQYENMQYLFKDLSISGENSIMAHQGQYPVIYLNFSDMKRGNCDFIKSQIKMKIWQSYLVFKKQMMESNLLDISEKNFIESITYEMSDNFAVNSIQCLCSFLSKIYINKASIVLLDNYDSIYAQNCNLQEMSELNDFFINFISSTFKDNKFMIKGLITGVMNVPLSSNFKVYIVASAKYSSCFGFTKNEMIRLIKFFKLNSKSDDIKKWYGGYCFGNNKEINIFNPFSVSHFFNNTVYFSNYWFKATGNIDFIIESIFHGSINIKDCLIRLIQRKNIQKELKDDALFNNNINIKNEESIWTQFLSLGYLTVKKEEISNENSRILYTLKMPNEEIIESFSELINEWFISNNFFMNEFMQAVIIDDKSQIESFVKNFVNCCFQLFSACSSFPEIIYHIFALGLVSCSRKSFKIFLNSQSTNGSICILMKSSSLEKCSNSFIFEFEKKYSLELNNMEVTSQFEILKNKFISNLVEEGFVKENIKEFCFDFTYNECKLNKEQKVININENNNDDNDDEPLIENNQTSDTEIYQNINDNDNNISNNQENINNDDDQSNDNQNNGIQSENISSIGLGDENEIPDFEFTKKPFNLREKVYVIDKNGYDIFEGIIVYKKKKILCIHYPEYPDDDEKITNKKRLLKQTARNKRIFEYQEKMRNENAEENNK